MIPMYQDISQLTKNTTTKQVKSFYDAIKNVSIHLVMPLIDIGPKSPQTLPLRSTQLKIRYSILLSMLLLVFSLASCGYRNPYVYAGPDRDLYITTWHNRTNELLLDAKIYQSLVRWFQKSGSIRVTKQKEGAQLILAGEIVSIDLPSLSYGAANDATEVKVLLTVRYILKDLESGKILLEVGNEVWTEEYKVGTSSSERSDNERKALRTIIDDLSERIYIKTLDLLSKKGN